MKHHDKNACPIFVPTCAKCAVSWEARIARALKTALRVSACGISVTGMGAELTFVNIWRGIERHEEKTLARAYAKRAYAKHCEFAQSDFFHCQKLKLWQWRKPRSEYFITIILFTQIKEDSSLRCRSRDTFKGMEPPQCTNCSNETFQSSPEQGGVVYRQKRGRKRPVSAQHEVRLKMATAQIRQMLVALPLHKKKWSNKKTGAERMHLTTIRSKICGPSIDILAMSESTNAREKKSMKSCRWPPRSACLAVRKRRCGALEQTWIKPNLVCFTCQITCAATDAGHCAPGATRTPQKTEKATPSCSPA